MKKINRKNDVLHLYELMDPRLQLDLTSEPWFLTEGDCSVLEGVDVVRPGGLRSALPRKPVGVSLDAGDQPVVYAMGSAFSGRASIRYAANCGGCGEISAGVFTNTEVTGVAYDSATREISKTGIAAFSLRENDRLVIFNPSHRGIYGIDSIVPADDIYLDRDAGIDSLSALRVQVCQGDGYNYGTTSYDDFNPTLGLAKGPILYEREGPWPDEMLNARIRFNEDGRGNSALEFETRVISSIESVIQPNDTLRWKTALPATPDKDDKFSILYSKEYTKRGVWVTNGRKIWLLAGGSFTLYLDMGDDSYLGTRWFPSTISSNLVMFVCGKYPPRVVRLDRPAATGDLDDSTLAGCLAPVKTGDLEGFDSSTNRSWWMKLVASGNGYITDGTNAETKILVRAVNLIDSGESEFVSVYDYDNPTQDYLDVSSAGTDEITVYNEVLDMDARATPPVHPRWTHIEVWRKPSFSADYFLETRIVLSGMQSDGYETTSGGLVGETVPGNYPCYLSDTDLVGLPFLTSADLNAGGLPPICQESQSLLGITVCAGRADPDAQDHTAYSRSHYGTTYQYIVSGDQLRLTGQFADYTYVDGDQFVITDGGSVSVAPGVYDIESSTDDDNIVLDLDEPLISSGTAGALRGYIRRPYTIEWPKVESDEEVWYSRSDRFSPESFPDRKLRVGYLGHKFKALRPISSYLAMIMDNSVHLIYFSDGQVLSDAVSSGGNGTPWRDSVVKIDNLLLWAHPNGPLQMTVSNNPDANGHRGSVSAVDTPGRMRKWFRDAFTEGQEIDGGVDTLNHLIRWRKRVDDNTFESAQYSYRTGQWVIIRDDAGKHYIGSDNVESLPLDDTVLYSVTDEGSVHRLNDEGLEDAYGLSAVSQAVTDESFEVRSAWLRKKGAFSPNMVGEVVRFRSSSNSGIDGVSRVIRSATADKITFDLLDGLDVGDEFIIGANRMRIRLAPFYGDLRTVPKTVNSLVLRALPGRRHLDGDWPHLEGGKITVRGIADYRYEDVIDRELGIFDADEEGKETEDRNSELSTQGASVEVEFECIESRTDLTIEAIEIELREDGDRVLDTEE